MRPPLLFAAFLALAAPAAGHPSAVAAQPARAIAVAISGFAFSPQTVTVAPGATVAWTNADDEVHTVTAAGGAFHSAALDTGETFRFTFTRPGTYLYFCSLHPHMTGKIVVRAG